MNPIKSLEDQLHAARAAVEQHERKYYWVKGFGTGWQGSHYGISQEEYDGAFDTAKELRQRVMDIEREIARLRRIARPGRRLSIAAHRG